MDLYHHSSIYLRVVEHRDSFTVRDLSYLTCSELCDSECLCYRRRWLGSGRSVQQHHETHLRLCKCMEPDAITTHILFFTARQLQ